MKNKAIFKTVRPEIKGVDMETGIIDMLIPLSTPSEDRDHETIAPEAWTARLPEFMKRPILVASHDYYDLENQIGEFVELIPTEKGLLGKPKYYINEGNETADWAFKLASKGMAAYSVGFIPHEFEDGEGEIKTKYTDCELLEISHVIVPSNREAIQGMRGKSHNPVLEQLMEDYLKSDIVHKPEETDSYFRIPVPKEEGKHKDCKIRTIDISENQGIKALYCVDDKVNITYLFDKKHDWDMEKAKKWVEDHSKSAKGISQKEIADELDYLIKIVERGNMNSENKKTLSDLAHRISESDISVKIAARHKEAITEAMDACKEAMVEMDEHHKAHNKSHAKKKDLLVKSLDTLKSMIEPAEQEPEEPGETEPGEPEEQEPEKSIDIMEVLWKAKDRISKN